MVLRQVHRRPERVRRSRQLPAGLRRPAPGSERTLSTSVVVEQCLRRAYGGDVTATEPGKFLVARLHPVLVRVSPVEDGGEVVDVATWVARGLELTPEVTRFLLERSARVRVGKLGVDAGGDIVVEHSLFPEELGFDVLVRVVELVSSVAAGLERELGERF